MSPTVAPSTPPAAPLGTGAPACTIAVIGNPNTGKSTVFNGLTGARQHVGNYPGITVERKQGLCRFGDGVATVIDLPGTYSLSAASPDEEIVLRVLRGEAEEVPRPDSVICVVDASNLRRNLFLVSQVGETGLPVVVALNMMDEAEARGIRIDVAELSKRLGVPVIPTVATKGKGIEELKAAARAAASTVAPVPWPDKVLSAAGGAGGLRRLFDGGGEELRAAGLDPAGVEATTRYAFIDRLLEGVATKATQPRGYAVDAILTHRFFGLVIFVALMFGVFSSIYWLAAPLMDGIEGLFKLLSQWAGAKLEGREMVKALVTDGIIAGVGGVVVFLPQILILFFFIAVLEDTGYMARAAFLMDKVFSWTGMNGKCFVPMLSSFACAVPSILATRTIDDPKARLSTILVSPLMSCSARLPVYVLFISAFIAPRWGSLWAGAALFGMHVLGLAVAIPVALVINRLILKGTSIPFLLEMPPYRRPSLRNVLLRMWQSGREFIARAGTVIFAMSILIWAMLYFPHPPSVQERVTAELASRGVTDEAVVEREVKSAYLEQSLMGRGGKAVQPVFGPAGFDWKITVAVLAAFPAREVLVSTLGIIYASEEKEDDEAATQQALAQKLGEAAWPDGRKVYTPAVAAALMVFFAFCLQCMSTITVIAKESGWRWASFAFFYMTGLAWIGAVLTYQLGSRL